MKIVCCADTHGHHEELKVPDGDMFIFAGDMIKWNSGEAEQVCKFNAWIGSLPHRYKIFVPGNHDRSFEQNFGLMKSLLCNAHVLNDSQVIIGDLKIWGSPFSPIFFDWAFGRARGETINKHWKMIPEDTDILITHGPPHKVLDLAPARGSKPAEHAGCVDLRRRIDQLKKLKLHVFGHIHEGYGIKLRNGVLHINASKDYYPTNNPPIVVEI